MFGNLFHHMSKVGWGWGGWWVWAGISEILNRRHMFTTSLPSPPVLQCVIILLLPFIEKEHKSEFQPHI